MSYPKWLYHKDKEALIVKSEDEHKALGDEWAESPADFEKADAAPEKPKRKKKEA
jgi:hypothetical protein